MQRIIIFILFVLIVPSSFSAPSCSVSILRSLNFGNYNPFSVNNDDSTARIRIKCRGRGSVSYQILLSTGQTGNYFPRKMKIDDGGSQQLNYNIYTKGNRTIIWGDGTSGTSTKQKTKSSPFTKRHTLYGQIPARQTTVKAGNYSDTILVTVNY